MIAPLAGSSRSRVPPLSAHAQYLVDIKFPDAKQAPGPSIRAAATCTAIRLIEIVERCSLWPDGAMNNTSQYLQWTSIGLAVLAALFAWLAAKVPLQYEKGFDEPFVEELKNLYARAEQHANFAAVQKAFARQSRLNVLAAVAAIGSAAVQLFAMFM